MEILIDYISWLSKRNIQNYILKLAIIADSHHAMWIVKLGSETKDHLNLFSKYINPSSDNGVITMHILPNSNESILEKECPNWTKGKARVMLIDQLLLIIVLMISSRQCILK